MKVCVDQIESFIPQRAPFIMVDNLINATANTFETDFRVRFDNIFLEEEELREFALLENIAQSCAVGLGYVNKANKVMPIDGFIGGISKLKLYKLPNVNDKIYTIITRLHQFENMYLLRGESFVDDAKLIECELKLVGLISYQPAN